MTPDQQTQLQVSLRPSTRRLWLPVLVTASVHEAHKQAEVQRELERREWAEPNGASTRGDDFRCKD